MRKKIKRIVQDFYVGNPSWQTLIVWFRTLFTIAFRRTRFFNHPGDTAKFVFLVGCGRSGNTLLRRLLMEGYDIYIPPETYVLARQINQFQLNYALSWPEIVDSVLLVLENHSEFQTLGVASLDGFKVDAKKWDENKKEFFFLVEELYRWLGENNGQRSAWVGDKTPLNTLSLGILNKAFPEAKFVYLERDPVDVVQSYLNAGIYTDAAEAACRWRISLRAWLKFRKSKKSSDVAVVRYEDLVSEPGKVVKELTEKFGIPERSESSDFGTVKLGDVDFYSHHGNVKNPPNVSSVGKGRATIKTDDLRKVIKVLGSLPESRGYKRIEICPDKACS